MIELANRNRRLLAAVVPCEVIPVAPVLGNETQREVGCAEAARDQSLCIIIPPFLTRTEEAQYNKIPKREAIELTKAQWPVIRIGLDNTGWWCSSAVVRSGANEFLEVAGHPLQTRQTVQTPAPLIMGSGESLLTTMVFYV